MLRLGPAFAVLLFGDRALLRPGGPGPLPRFLGLRKPVYRPHPYTLYELNPEWQSASGRARHNSLGFRGREISKEKRAGVFRIVCMGESTTYCTGIDDDSSTYPARLEVHLRALRPELDIEVINAGVGGYTSIENLLRYHFHVAPLSPDLIIYYYTHNDVHPRRLPHLSRDYREYSRSWHEPPFGGGIKGWIARRRALATGDIGNIVRRYDEYPSGSRRSANTAKNPPDYFRANITALIVLARAAGTRLMFVNPPYRNLQQDGGMDSVFTAIMQHRDIVEELSALFGFPVYDLASEMPYPSDPRGFPSEYYLDPTHVNEKGADLMAELIAKAMVAANVLN